MAIRSMNFSSLFIVSIFFLWTFSNIFATTNDKQHFTNVLRQIFLHRTTSSFLSDCTLNVVNDEIYRIPSDTTLSAEVIRLVREHFDVEIRDVQRLVAKIRSKLNQRVENSKEFSLGEFRQELSLDFRLILASQIRIKEIHWIVSTNDNGISSYRLKYSRVDPSLIDFVDYDNVHEEISSNNFLLQTFTVSKARETINDDEQQRLLFNNGWWLGPVLCEKNPNETSIMSHIFPISNRFEISFVLFVDLKIETKHFLFV